MIDTQKYAKYGSFMLIIMSVMFIVVSGISFGIIYFTMDTIQTSLESQSCAIDGNSLVSNCQELFELSLYPLLKMKSILVWGNIFLIFGAVLGMLFLGYSSGRSPFLLGIMTLLLSLFTYFGIEISNIYRTFLENAVFRQMMIEFTFYNRLMLNLPLFIFIVAGFSTLLGVVNYQKVRINKNTDELNF